MCGSISLYSLASRLVIGGKQKVLLGSAECLAASVERGRVSCSNDVGNDRHTGPAFLSDRPSPVLLRRLNSRIAFPLPILFLFAHARPSELCTSAWQMWSAHLLRTLRYRRGLSIRIRASCPSMLPVSAAIRIQSRACRPFLSTGPLSFSGCCAGADSSGRVSIFEGRVRWLRAVPPCALVRL